VRSEARRRHLPLAGENQEKLDAGEKVLSSQADGITAGYTHGCGLDEYGRMCLARHRSVTV